MDRLLELTTFTSGTTANSSKVSHAPADRDYRSGFVEGQ